MRSPADTMRLVAMVQAPTGQYADAWRHPMSRQDWLDARFYVDLARTLERGCFDLMFVPDALAVPEDRNGDFATTVRTGGKGTIHLDPVVVLSVVAGATSHIGLGATVSTTFVPPWTIARTMLSLDHLSGGRAAWNVVTSTTDAEARNFGLDRIADRSARYEHADRVVQTVLDLWSSWQPDALTLDAAGRQFADPAGLSRVPARAGETPLSRGPLTLPRSPQGRPVLMQAGASPRGTRFAARWAELVFAVAGDADTMRRSRAGLRAAAEAGGRDPDGLLYLPAVQPVVGATSAAAREELAGMEALLDEPHTLAVLGRLLHASAEELDPAVDAVQLLQAHRGATGSDGFEQMLLATARSERLTVRELAARQAVSQLKPQPVGDPVEVADQLCELFESGAADGFVVTFPLHPTSAQAFVDGVVPELQRRGRLRCGYTGTHLREHLFGAADAGAATGR